MKNVTVFLNQILLTGICLVLLSCTQTNNDRLPDPKIQAGIAKLSGMVTDFHLKKGEEKPTITLLVPNPVTAEMGTFETSLNENGGFYFEVPVECNMTIGHINSPAFNQNLVNVGLIPGEETKIELSFDKTGQIKAKMTSSLELTSDDILNYGKMFGNFLEASDHERCYAMTPEEFSHFAIEKMMVKRIKVSISDSGLSKKGKNYFSNECKLFYLKGMLLTYRDYISLNYRNFKTKGEPDNFTAQEPNKSYYALLKSFNLNDSQYLYNDSYPVVLQSILSNETLNIPAIKDTPVKDWLKEVKTIMADLIGSDAGLFYDMLAANAYAWQFSNESQTLSDKQKENIRNYFKNEEVTKILLRKNKEIIKSEKGKTYFKTIINKTPAVPKEAMMNAIISKYKGKAVLVDFWATFCGPCMNAIKETRKVKCEMIDKNIAFVYITDVASPKKLWEANINMIGGEHYYLTKDEMNYLKKSFGFIRIPYYLVYDAKGVLKNKITAYPGTKIIQKMIEEVLP